MIESAPPISTKEKLTATDVDIYYGTFHAIKNASLKMHENSVTALIITAGLSVGATSPNDLNPFHTAETLAVHLWYTHSESIVPDVDRIGNGSALVLLIMVLIFNIAARVGGRALSKRLTGRPT